MRKTRQLIRVTAVFLFVLFLSATAAYATLVNVNNASFESSSGTTFRSKDQIGTWSLRDMSDWTHFGSNTYEWGIWDPATVLYSSIPDGNYMGYLNGGYLSQDLGWEITANTELTMLIDIGNNPLGVFPQYSVELWAYDDLDDDLLLVSDGSVVPVEGGWSTMTLGYTVLDGDQSIGKTLGIRIVSGGNWLNFDNVRVSNDGLDNNGINPVPEPATMLLLGSGLVGLAGFGRKKFFKK